MEVVNTLDIDGTQWEIQDVKARGRIEEIAAETNKIIDITLSGTFIFYAKMKYLGEDETYKYYSFWWDSQNRSYKGSLNAIEILPQNMNTDKIMNLNLNILQLGNASIIQQTQHYSGQNNAGVLTYVSNVTANPDWIISGMGVLRRTK